MTTVPATPTDDSPPRIDQVLEGLIFALLLYLPLAFGGVMPRSHVVLSGLGALIAACFAIRCVSEPEARISWSWIFVPAVGLLATAAFQLVELPIDILGAVSPKSAEIWRAALGAAGGTAAAGTISIYPEGTQIDLRVLLVGVTLLIAASSVYRERAPFSRLLGGIGVFGLLVASIGLVQTALGADLIYWMFKAPGRPNAGPFAVHSHYCEYINLALGCAVGYLLISAGDRVRGHDLDLQRLLQTRWTRAPVLNRALVAFLVIGPLAVAVSGSRNGLVSLVVGVSVCAALLHWVGRVKGIGWPIIGFMVLAALGLLTLGIDPVIKEFGTMLTPESESLSIRLELVRDSAAMVRSFPAFGAGLGTFALAFPAFDQSLRRGTAEHAENEYMELASEMGTVGAMLALILIAILVVTLLKRLRRKPKGTNLGLFGIALGVSAVAFHAITDFGLEIPAVGLLVATLAGAVVARSAKHTIEGVPARLMVAAAFSGAAIFLALSIPSMISTARASNASLKGLVMERKIQAEGGVGTEAEHRKMAELFEQAHRLDPGNPDNAFMAAFTEWNELIARSRGYTLDSDPVHPGNHPELAVDAKITVDRLLENLAVAPTHGRSWSVAGQLSRIWLDKGEAAGEWILRGRELAPHHPTICLAAALERLRRNDTAGAIYELQRATAIGASKAGVVDLLAVELAAPRLARLLARDDLVLTERLLAHVIASDEDRELANELNKEVYDLLVAACSRPSAKPDDLARLASLETDDGEFKAAIELYRRLLSVDPFSEARFEYARVLASSGEISRAIGELEDVLQFHPKHPQATQLLKDLSQH